MSDVWRQWWFARVHIQQRQVAKTSSENTTELHQPASTTCGDHTQVPGPCNRPGTGHGPAREAKRSFRRTQSQETPQLQQVSVRSEQLLKGWPIFSRLGRVGKPADWWQTQHKIYHHSWRKIKHRPSVCHINFSQEVTSAKLQGQHSAWKKLCQFHGAQGHFSD